MSEDAVFANNAGQEPVAVGIIDKTGHKQHPAVRPSSQDAVPTASHNTTVRSSGIFSPV